MNLKYQTVTVLAVLLASLTAAAQPKMTCSLQAPDLTEVNIPLVYDGLQKKYELPFMLQENEDGVIALRTFTVEEFMPALNGKMEEEIQAVNLRNVDRPLAGFFGRQNAKKRVNLGFSVAEVRVKSRGGEITPSTPVRLSLRNGHSLGPYEESVHTTEVPMSVCPKADLTAAYFRASGAVSEVQVRINCNCN